jgi:hypothetical protein
MLAKTYLYIVCRRTSPDSSIVPYPPDWCHRSRARVPTVHEIAKLILEHAETLWERSEAISKALYLGMPLNEIEEYLDWLEMLRRGGDKPADDEKPSNG